MIWKTFAGHCIHDSPTGIQVRENRRYRWLTFGGHDLQTVLHRHHPERAGLAYIQALTLAARTSPAPSCLLGLGGAGVAHALAPLFGEIPLDAIESSQDVIDIGLQYFMTGKISNLHTLHLDALLHVQHSTTRYQHLMIDLFNAHSFPDHCNNTAFFESCQKILLPGGIMAVNLANHHEQWPIFQHIRARCERQ